MATVDPLSDVLRAVRLRGALFYDVEGVGPWAAAAPPSERLRPAILPGAGHLIEFHGVLRGACWAATTGVPAVRLETGDVVLFPQGDAHVMSSAPGLVPTRADAPGIVPGAGDTLPLPVAIDATGVSRPREGTAGPGATRIVCGFLGVDARPFNPLLAALPRVLTLPAAATSSWMGALLGSAADATTGSRPGGHAVLERMSEVLFVEAVRRHAETLPADRTGWLAAVRDPVVGRALRRLHGAPAEPWTLERLQAEVGASRSAFHERFVELVGLPPMQYLLRWRMQAAARLLRDTTWKVLRVAMEVGYESEAAFARAFRRVVGTSPGAWRRGDEGDGADPAAPAAPGPGGPAPAARGPVQPRTDIGAGDTPTCDAAPARARTSRGSARPARRSR